jgi:hypothetical protein
VIRPGIPLPKPPLTTCPDLPPLSLRSLGDQMSRVQISAPRLEEPLEKAGSLLGVRPNQDCVRRRQRALAGSIASAGEDIAEQTVGSN